jgi:hypothetical protein
MRWAFEPAGSVPFRTDFVRCKKLLRGAGIVGYNLHIALQQTGWSAPERRWSEHLVKEDETNGVCDGS